MYASLIFFASLRATIVHNDNNLDDPFIFLTLGVDFFLIPNEVMSYLVLRNPYPLRGFAK